MRGAAEFWRNLPGEVARRLALGSVGREQLVVLAGIAPRLAVEFLSSAWADCPLDADVAKVLEISAVRLRRPLPAPLGALLRSQREFWRPARAGDPWLLAAEGERRVLLEERLRTEPKNLFWKLAAWNAAWPEADWSLADRILDEGGWPQALGPLRRRFAAQVLLCRGDPHAALASLNAAAATTRFADDSPLRAECLLRMDRRDEAVSVLRECVARSPWRTNEALRLSDFVSGADAAIAPAPAPCAVLVYSYDKAAELDATLASLADSDLGDSVVFALDNGSSDATPEVLAGWRARLGDRLSVVTLPVNIGAPAARNWLLALPEVRARPFVAFVDDDVSLPRDWLLRLGAAAQRVPEASVWGCRVVEDANPLVAQNVEYSPLPPKPGEQLLVLPNLHLGLPDLGRFAYLRPCVSVTGCCHLLRTADIPRTGGFDIRFSPSQYDDLERDLRLFLSGGFACYQGHLAVRHKRRSGALAQRSAAEIGSAAANAHKLQTKFDEGQFRAISRRGADMLVRDILLRLSAL